MERKEYQTKLSNSYYRNEDELRETIDVQPVLNCHMKKVMLYRMLVKGIVNQSTYEKVNQILEGEILNGEME